MHQICILPIKQYTFLIENWEENIEFTWKVLEGGNSSDHRPILIKIKETDHDVKISRGYNIRNVQLDRLEETALIINKKLSDNSIYDIPRFEKFIISLTDRTLKCTRSSCREY